MKFGPSSYLKKQECKGVLQFIVHIISKCFLYDFAKFMGLDVHLLQIKVYCYKDNHTTDITLQSERLFFLVTISH
jgi:hypothetical protein